MDIIEVLETQNMSLVSKYMLGYNLFTKKNTIVFSFQITSSETFEYIYIYILENKYFVFIHVQTEMYFFPYNVHIHSNIYKYIVANLCVPSIYQVFIYYKILCIRCILFLRSRAAWSHVPCSSASEQLKRTLVAPRRESNSSVQPPDFDGVAVAPRRRNCQRWGNI